ncbi:Uma2 family endonuclease [Granulicella sp. WH15]|uniref:Uma2 family endonuclease n=1 Tax=Granulicella sp. WH15 TaxID=2602070 RepID=UPI001366AA68|nr:Uma2 family endonuclease [Granulicella sp. WH15]QHN03489.1 Uma2 family endonuclease [Granulicella sp. WH15]
MVRATLIPVSEYLNTTYRPDCDYIDGAIEERNVGERPHAFMQSILVAIFNGNRRAWNVVAATGLRVQTSVTRYRIPDVCVLRRSDQVEAIVLAAPLVCIEVLSPRDTMSSMQERVDDYTRMGVEHIWLIDPVSRHAYIATDTGFQRPSEGAFTVSGTPIRVLLDEVFGEFDEMMSQL